MVSRGCWGCCALPVAWWLKRAWRESRLVWGGALSLLPGALVICMLPRALVQQNSGQAGVAHVCAERGGVACGGFRAPKPLLAY